jgi:hypothetical protein
MANVELLLSQSQCSSAVRRWPCIDHETDTRLFEARLFGVSLCVHYGGGSEAQVTIWQSCKFLRACSRLQRAASLRPGESFFFFTGHFLPEVRVQIHFFEQLSSTLGPTFELVVKGGMLSTERGSGRYYTTSRAVGSRGRGRRASRDFDMIVQGRGRRACHDFTDSRAAGSGQGRVRSCDDIPTLSD